MFRRSPSRSTQHGPRSAFSLLLTAVVALTCPYGYAADLKSAERSLMSGRVDEAVKSLRAATAANPKDGAAHLLLCRAFYSEDLAGDAVRECEAALANGLAGNSAAQDWMGRVYGKKADMSGPLTGLKLAHRVKDAFEAALNLDPGNADAADDLGEYYIEAPPIVGGGLDRARALVARLSTRLPERSQRLRALIAEKQNDYPTAERDLRAIAEGKPDRADGWLDLAAFYQRTKSTDKAVAAARQSILINKKRDPSLYQAATILIKLKTEPALAEQALRSYLAGDSLDDGAPAFQAHYQLGKLLSSQGNPAGARAEYQAALALAPDFAAARKALAQ